MNWKINAFLSVTLLLGVTTIAHAEMDTVPAKIIPLFTFPEATSDLETSTGGPISKSQIDHLSLAHKHPQSIPHEKATSASASQNDVTILCYLLYNGGGLDAEGPLKMSTPVNSPFYKQQCEKNYPSCGSDCHWKFM